MSLTLVWTKAELCYPAHPVLRKDTCNSQCNVQQNMSSNWSAHPRRSRDERHNLIRECTKCYGQTHFRTQAISYDARGGLAIDTYSDDTSEAESSTFDWGLLSHIIDTNDSVMSSSGVGFRAPKDDFMRALGLDPSSALHEDYYQAMRVCSRL